MNSQELEFTELAEAGLKKITTNSEFPAVASAIRSKVMLQDPWTFASSAAAYPHLSAWIWTFAIFGGRKLRVLFSVRDGRTTIHAVGLGA